MRTYLRSGRTEEGLALGRFGGLNSINISADLAALFFFITLYAWNGNASQGSAGAPVSVATLKTAAAPRRSTGCIAAVTKCNGKQHCHRQIKISHPLLFFEDFRNYFNDPKN